jgi:vancomycin aglycone glucosyltransferase
MRVVLSTYDSRGGVEPLAGLAVQLQALGAEVTVCGPPDEEFAERLAGLGVPLVPFGPSVRAMATREAPPSEEELRQQMDELIAAQFHTVAAAAEGCDALVSTNLLATSAGARSVAEQLGIHYVYASYQPSHLPSPHHPPPAYAGFPFLGFIDNGELWDQDAQNANLHFGPTLNGHRASIGLPPVDDIRTHAFTEHPWLAADPTLAPWQEPADLDVVQTGAWLLPDDRALPAELLDFVDAGTPPVYVGFGSMSLRAGKNIVGTAIEAIRAQGRRVLLAQGWAELAPIDDRDDCFLVGEINHQELFGRVAAVVHHGGAGTTTTAARAGAPQVVVPQGADQVYWASRVVGMGIGTAYDGRSANSEAFSAAIEAALAPDTASLANSTAGKIRTDGATVAATLLVDAISCGRPGQRLR